MHQTLVACKAATWKDLSELTVLRIEGSQGTLQNGHRGQPAGEKHKNLLDIHAGG